MMFEVYALLVICTILGYLVKNSSFNEEKDGLLVNACNSSGKIILFILISYFVIFAGLRTFMNDTAVYIRNFTKSVSGSTAAIAEIDWSIGANPLFETYQILLKTFVSSSGQVFIFITSLIVEMSMVRFMYKYSCDFGLTVYIFIAFTVFAFTMAAMKQTLATAIGIWAIPEFVKGKRIKGLVILAIAVLVHPYIFMFAAALFLVNKGTWNKLVYLILIVTILLGFSFASFINRAVSITEMIGDSYDIQEFFSAGTGVGILRILSYMIAPGLALISNKELKDNSNPLQDLFINFSIIAMALSILSGFGGSVLVGRLPNYFDIFICISIPYVINYGNSTIAQNRTLITIVLMAAYLFFFYTYYHNYFIGYGVSFWGSVYYRTSLGAMLSGW